MKTLLLSLILIASTAFGQTYQAPSENGAVIVATCGTAPSGYPTTSGVRAPNTVDVNGNACSSGGGGGSNPAAGATGAAVPADASYNGLSIGGTLTGQTGTNNGGKISADVNITGGSTGNGAASNTGSAVPVQADYVGGNLAGLLAGIVAYTDAGSSDLGVHVANTVVENMAQVNGTTADTNSGNVSAGTLRIVPATNSPQTASATPWAVRPSDGTNFIADAAIGAALTSNPVPSGCHNETSPTTIGNTQAGVPECDTSQRLIAVGAGTAGTATGGVVTVQGVASMTPILANPGTAANWAVGATGAGIPANASFQGAQNTAGNLYGDIVCDKSIIYDTNTNGATQLVAISGSTHVYVCGYELFAAGTVNVSLIAGTGSACASAVSGTPSTGNTGASAKLTPAWEFTTQTGKLSAYPTHGWLIDAGSANALCLNTSAGVAVQAQVFYSQR
jgi:hypothetical protein